MCTSVCVYPFSSRQNFNTALHLAVESGSADMVEALLTVPDINLGILNEVKTYIMPQCLETYIMPRVGYCSV